MPDPDPLSRLASGPVFVVGWVRSGTTWLYDVLTSHPEVGGVLESWMFTKTHGVQGPLGELHWEPDGDGSIQGLARIADREEIFDDVRGLTSRWLARGLAPGERFLVEKSPSHVFAIDLIAELYPDARFVHIIRDGRDVAVSVRAASGSWAPGWRSTIGSSLKEAAQSWNRAVLSGMRLGAELGDRYLEVHYEEMLADPGSTYSRIFDHCGIPLTEQQLEQIVADNSFRSDGHGDGGFRRRAEPGAWKGDLKPWEAIAVTRAAREGLLAAEYEPGRLWGLRG